MQIVSSFVCFLSGIVPCNVLKCFLTMGRWSHSNWYYLRKCQAAFIPLWPSTYQPPLVNRDPLHSLSYWQACFTSPLPLLVPKQQPLLLLVYLCFLHRDSLQDIITSPQRWLFVTLIQSTTNAKKPVSDWNLSLNAHGKSRPYLDVRNNILP